MIARRSLMAISLAALMLGACSMQPTYVRTELPVPGNWPVGDAYLRSSEAALPSYNWHGVFADPRLQALITQALANNQDVKRAAANIEAARAQYQIQRSELLPQLDISSTYRRSDSSGPAQDSFAAQGSISGYELDLFGRLRSLSGAAQDKYFASEAASRATRLTLVSDAVTAWLKYAADSTLLTIASNTAADARESLRLTKLRLDGGIAPRSDMRQAEIVLRTAEADIAAQTTAVAQDANALRLLVGSDIAPENLSNTIGDAAGKLREVPAGLDSTILLRRPDVLEAEWQLRAANAQIGAARAALFPKISLTGLLGFASTSLGGLFNSGNFAWSAGGTASYPIFNGGGSKAGVALSEAQRDAALASYRKAIQSAFADVGNALARRGTIEAQVEAVSQGRDAAADNLHLADLRYKGGRDSYLQELTARQALYSAERSLVATQLLRATNLVSLYRSLGGDASLGDQ